MCGIAGRAGSPLTPAERAGALELLRHRGPDDSGAYCWEGPNGNIELLHTRLSIVDLSDAGAQPMANPSGRYVMVFNGEIYNSPELRRHCEAAGHTFRSHMDGEVILHLWEDEGIDALRRLNGIFALAMADTTTGEVVLARDPIGVKPLFYSTAGGDLSFASELASLRALGADLGGHDLVGLAQFLTFLWVPDPHTPYAGAHSLKPGHAVRWANGRAQEIEYCDLGDHSVDQPEPDDVAEHFTAAARRQLLADVPIAIMASGGVDSSLIWWATRDAITRAYCIRWPADDLGEGLEEDAAAVAELSEPSVLTWPTSQARRPRPSCCHRVAICSPTRRTS